MSNFSNNSHYLSSVNIDLISSDANHSFSDCNKLWLLEDKIVPPDDTHLIIGVQSFVMPYSFWNFRDGVNNSFTITTDTSSYVIVIAPGNYADFELMSYLNIIFTSMRAAIGLSTLSIYLDQATGKFFLNVLPASNVTISDVSCFKEIGFYSSTVGYSWSNATTCNFPYRSNLAGDTSLYIRLKHKGIKNINSKRVTGIIANIPIRDMPNQFIYYNPTEIQYFKTTSDMSSIEISILDDQMNEIGDLNSSTSWRITLSCHFSFDKKLNSESDIDKLIRKMDELINIQKIKSMPKIISNVDEQKSETNIERNEKN